MRFYLKLVLMVALVACASAPWSQRFVDEGCFEVRLALVNAFGSPAEKEAMVDLIQRRLAEKGGNLNLYLVKKHADRLLAERLADAARRDIRLSEGQVDRLREQCLAEAFGQPEPDVERESLALAGVGLTRPAARFEPTTVRAPARRWRERSPG